MKIVIVTSCTAEKSVHAEGQLTMRDFQEGERHVHERERELSNQMLPAEEMYCGQQHVRLMRGVKAVREEGNHDIDLRILSAGYGLIPAEREIAPYEYTFSDMPKTEIRDWAWELGIPSEFRRVIGRSFDIGIVLLGNDYLEACDLAGDIELGGQTLFFCSASAAEQIREIDRALPIALGNQEARRFSCGLIHLKGEMGRRVLKMIVADGEAAIDQLFDAEDDVLTSLA